MIEREKLDEILGQYGLVLVENRYLKGKNHEDGTVGFEAIQDSIFLNNKTRDEVLKEVGKLLNPPPQKRKKVVKKEKVVGRMGV